LGQNEHYHGPLDAQQLGFCCLMFDARTRKCILSKMMNFCSKWLTIQNKNVLVLCI
jgi:hypothetical protein